MQWAIIARDDRDSDALARRMRARDAHLSYTQCHQQHMVMGVATLDDRGEMNGSIMIVDFPTREMLDQWLAQEPYRLEGVWQEITIIPCAIGPSFLKQSVL